MQFTFDMRTVSKIDGVPVYWKNWYTDIYNKMKSTYPKNGNAHDKVAHMYYFTISHMRLVAAGGNNFPSCAKRG